MLSDNELREVVKRYELRHREEPRANRPPLHLAWYAELPGCLVESDSRDGALSELDTLVVPFLQGILQDGGKVPTAISERRTRVRTFHATWTGFVVGDVAALLGAKKMAENPSTNLSEPVEHVQLEPVHA